MVDGRVVLPERLTVQPVFFFIFRVFRKKEKRLNCENVSLDTLVHKG